jgi:hypothetical protein
MTSETLSSSMMDIHASISMKSQGLPAIFELTGQAPAPNQTHYHLGVYDKSTTHPLNVILTGFPRKRLTQSWSRDRFLHY